VRATGEMREDSYSRDRPFGSAHGSAVLVLLALVGVVAWPPTGGWISAAVQQQLRKCSGAASGAGTLVRQQPSSTRPLAARSVLGRQPHPAVQYRLGPNPQAVLPPGLRCCDAPRNGSAVRNRSSSNRATNSLSSLSTCLLLCPSLGLWPGHIAPRCPLDAGERAPVHYGALSGEQVGTYVCAAHGGLWKSGTSAMQEFIHRSMVRMCDTHPGSGRACNTSGPISPTGVLAFPDEVSLPPGWGGKRKTLFWHGKGFLHTPRWDAGTAMVFMVRDPREAIVSLWEWMHFPRSSPPAGALVSCMWAVDKAREALEIVEGAAQRLNEPQTALLLIKHSSLSSHPTIVYRQVFGFLGLSVPWARVERQMIASMADVKSHLSAPRGRQQSINYRGAISGSARYQQRLPLPAANFICQMMRASPAVAALFLEGVQLVTSDLGLSLTSLPLPLTRGS
jgi:hypothetical protein